MPCELTKGHLIEYWRWVANGKWSAPDGVSIHESRVPVYTQKMIICSGNDWVWEGMTYCNCHDWQEIEGNYISFLPNCPQVLEPLLCSFCNVLHRGDWIWGLGKVWLDLFPACEHLLKSNIEEQCCWRFVDTRSVCKCSTYGSRPDTGETKVLNIGNARLSSAFVSKSPFEYDAYSTSAEHWSKLPSPFGNEDNDDQVDGKEPYREQSWHCREHMIEQILLAIFNTNSCSKQMKLFDLCTSPVPDKFSAESQYRRTEAKPQPALTKLLRSITIYKIGMGVQFLLWVVLQVAVYPAACRGLHARIRCC